MEYLNAAGTAGRECGNSQPTGVYINLTSKDLFIYLHTDSLYLNLIVLLSLYKTNWQFRRAINIDFLHI